MDNKKSRDTLHTPLRVVFIGLMIAIVTAVCQTSNGTIPPPEPEEHPTEGAQVLVPAQIRRELANVWVGVADGSEDELSTLEDGDWHELLLQELVVTNENGEGWIDISIEDKECLRIYVFQSSKLTKAACPKSAYQGGNVICNLEGTDAFNNTCASQVIIQTLSVEIQLEGTWLSVSYLPDLELSLLMVLEGQARIQPVVDLQSRELGDEILVTENQFLFTMPDASLADIGSLEPRQSHPIELLPPMIDDLGLRQWIYRIRNKSEADMGAQLPVPPEILEVDYPDQVPSEITENNPLPWSLRFRDPDGDVYRVVGEVQEVEVVGDSIDSFDFRVNANDIIEGDEKEGVVQFVTWCTGAVGVVKYQLTIIDEAGYRSLPVEFFQRCVPGTPTPTQTDTPIPTATNTATSTPTPTPTNTPTPTRTPTPFPPPSGQIIFTSNRSGDRELYSMNPDGTNLTRMTFVNGDDSRASWSPGADWIAFASSRDGDWEIYYMVNTPGGDTFQLTGNTSVNEFDPSYSPDGNRIAFSSNRDGDFEVFVTTTDIIDGPFVDQLTFNTASDGCPDWSPDGNLIAFSSDRDGNREIYVMNADGSGQTRLTNNPALDNCPTWSPDGQTLAFRSDRDGDAEMWLMDANGSNQRQLTHNSVDDWGPAPWSPDGNWITFLSNRGGNWEIVIISVDGRSEINLTRNSAYDAYPDWGPSQVIVE